MKGPARNVVNTALTKHGNHPALRRPFTADAPAPKDAAMPDKAPEAARV